MHLCVSVVQGFAKSRRGCGRFAVVQCVRPVPSELWRGRAVAVWCVAWWSGARRGAGAVRSDIRVSEAKRGRVPL